VVPVDLPLPPILVRAASLTVLPARAHHPLQLTGDKEGGQSTDHPMMVFVVLIQSALSAGLTVLPARAHHRLQLIGDTEETGLSSDVYCLDCCACQYQGTADLMPMF
jgi:hypothetical protein